MSVALAVLLASSSWIAPTGQAPVEAATPYPVPAGARVVLVGADGTERAAPLEGFELLDLRTAAAVLVRFEDGSPDPVAQADDALLELAGGELLCGPIVGGEGERIEVRIAGGLAVPADLERIHALRFPKRLAGSAGVEPAAEGDRIFRVQSNGVERIDGAVEGFTEGGVRFHGALVGTIAVPWRNVAALFVEHMGSKPPKRDAEAMPVALDLDDGSRLAGIFLGIRGRAIELNRRGTTLKVPVESALQLARDDGSIAFLSAVAPASAESSRPFGDDLGMVWDPRFDRNVSGGPLRTGGARHPRGIGVHAPSRMTWKLDGDYRTLRGSVALDDEVLRLAAGGSCVFRVLLDGREAFASAVLRGGEPSLPFHVDLAGAKELALVVDATDDGFAGDRADWLGLVLSRAQAPAAGDSKR